MPLQKVTGRPGPVRSRPSRRRRLGPAESSQVSTGVRSVFGV